MRIAVIDRSREILHGPEAERAKADHLDLVIHPFELSIRDPRPGQDTIEMSA